MRCIMKHQLLKVLRFNGIMQKITKPLVILRLNLEYNAKTSYPQIERGSQTYEQILD